MSSTSTKTSESIVYKGVFSGGRYLFIFHLSSTISILCLVGLLMEFATCKLLFFIFHLSSTISILCLVGLLMEFATCKLLF